MAAGKSASVQVPEILGIGEDHSDVDRRDRGGKSSPSDVLSVYLEGGPRYRLGTRVHQFEAPAAILIPKGTVDDDLQEGRVNGIFALFRGHGLLRPVGKAPGVNAAIWLGEERRVVPCLKELPREGAERIATALREISSVRGAELTGRLRRAALLLGAVSDYCEAEGRTGPASVHRSADLLRRLIDGAAFEDVPMEAIYGKLDVSSAHAETLFRAAFGTTPVGYRRQLRLRRARELLVSSRMNVGEIARAVGFADPLYFSRVFRKAFGATPSSLIRDFSNRRR